MIPKKVIGDIIHDMEIEINDLRLNIRLYGDSPYLNRRKAETELERLEKEVDELNAVYEFIVRYNEEHKDD